MSSIDISDLNVAGISLFVDQESYLDEVTADDLESIQGGLLTSPVCIFTAASSPECAGFAVGVVKSAAVVIGSYVAARALTRG
ncbi:MAG: hypothetical protein ICV54_05230 [Nostoc sp. C3-bin3]|nr:hypothetical protein [Nostoc sp. C3-bin3]